MDELSINAERMTEWILECNAFHDEFVEGSIHLDFINCCWQLTCAVYKINLTAENGVRKCYLAYILITDKCWTIPSNQIRVILFLNKFIDSERFIGDY
jgi:hypothetical protein